IHQDLHDGLPRGHGKLTLAPVKHDRKAPAHRAPGSLEPLDMHVFFGTRRRSGGEGVDHRCRATAIEMGLARLPGHESCNIHDPAGLIVDMQMNPSWVMRLQSENLIKK